VNDSSEPVQLSRLTTLWTVVLQAHQSAGEELFRTQQVLMERYAPAIDRYLRNMLRDPDVADEVFQNFALRFVRGGLRHARPENGRFRDYLKQALRNLIADYYRCQARAPVVPWREQDEPAAAPVVLPSDQAFVDRWREELLQMTWSKLAQLEKQTEQPWFTVLRLKADQPQLTSAEMAEQLSIRLGKPLRDDWVRQRLRRAREKFANLLLDEVALSVPTTDLNCLEQELIDLGLQAYCRSTLKKRLAEQIKRAPPSACGPPEAALG